MSFIAYDSGSHFPLQNLPYGVYTRRGNANARICTAIGTYVVDLRVLSEAGHFPAPLAAALQQAWGTISAFSQHVALSDRPAAFYQRAIYLLSLHPAFHLHRDALVILAAGYTQ